MATQPTFTAQFDRIPDLAATLDTLEEHFDRRRPESTSTTADGQKIALYREEGILRAFSLPAQTFTRRHTFDYREDFVAFLLSPTCNNDAGPVFVSLEGAVCDLTYTYRRGRMAGAGDLDPPDPTLPPLPTGLDPATLAATLQFQAAQRADLVLAESAAFAALLTLARGVSQRALWKALSTVLRDTVSPQHLLEVSDLDLARSESASLRIDRIGATARQASKTVRLTYRRKDDGGETSADLSTDWTFSLPRFRSWPEPFDLETVLEFDPETAKFYLHPVNLDAFEDQALAAVAAALRADLAPNADRFPVFRASIGAR